MAIRDLIQVGDLPTAQARVERSAGQDQGPGRAASGPCPVCGGSGSLRLSDQRYRTCLDCLGTGSAA